MDFDKAKENIQPLAAGRNAKILEIAINAEESDEMKQELLRLRSEFEKRIHNYAGSDPLEPWFEYVSWVEQCFPKSGKEGGIDVLLKQCLKRFANDVRYNQDRRMVQLYIKYIDSLSNPTEVYQKLYNAGIGTLVADFYICWAHYYDASENFNKANEIFKRGRDAGAQPLDELDMAHKNFSYSLPDRMLNNEDANFKRSFLSTMEEKRQALTSLRSYKHKYVGSVRTGSVVKSHEPGRLQSTHKPFVDENSGNSRQQISIFREPDGDSFSSGSQAVQGIAPETSIIHSIIDHAQKENKTEPGPWTKSTPGSTSRGNCGKVIEPRVTTNLGFTIMEDSEDMETDDVEAPNVIRTGGICLPPNFARRNRPQTDYSEDSLPALCIEDDRGGPLKIPCYDKIQQYPGNNVELSIEELRGYYCLKLRGIKNNRTEMCDKSLLNDYRRKCRLYPFFAKKNLPQTNLVTEAQPTETLYSENICYANWKLADETSIEEDLRKRWVEALKNKNKTIFDGAPLDETMINLCAKKIDIDNNEMVDASHVMIEDSQSPKNKALSFNIFCDEGSSNVADSFKKPIQQNMSNSIRHDPVQIRSIPQQDSHFNQRPFVVPANNFVSSLRGSKHSEQFAADMTNSNVGSQSVLSEKQVEEIVKPVIMSRDSQSREAGSTSRHQTDNAHNSSEREFQMPFAPAERYTGTVRKSSNSLRQSSSETTLQSSQSIPDHVFKSPEILSYRKQPNSFRHASSPEPMEQEIDEHVFKSPEMPSARKFAIFEDDQPPPPPPSCPVNRFALMDDDITCSTQNFNLFIKQSGVSTPKIMSKSESQQTQRNVQPILFALPERAANDSMHEISPPSYLPKQLSIIIETSESNTLSSATHTKLSNDDQCGSMDSHHIMATNKSNKICQNPNLDIIVESSVEQKELSRNSIVEATKENDGKEDDQFLDTFLKTPEYKKNAPNESQQRVQVYEDHCSRLEMERINTSITIPSFRITNDMVNGIKGINKPTTVNHSVLPDFSTFPDHSKIIDVSHYDYKNELASDVKTVKEMSIKHEHCTTILAHESKDEKLSKSNSAGENMKFEIFNDCSDSNKISDMMHSQSKEISYRKMNDSKKNSFVQHPSLHIKSENSTTDTVTNLSHEISMQLHISQTLPNISVMEKSMQIKRETTMDSNQSSKTLVPSILQSFGGSESQYSYQDNNLENLGKSIYVQSSSLPINTSSDSVEWMEDDQVLQKNLVNIFCHKEVDLDQTKQNIEHIFGKEDLNPFSSELCNAFLDELDFCAHIEKRPDCSLVKAVPYLKTTKQFQIQDTSFDVIEFKAKGAYGYVYRGRNNTTAKFVAMKQERPANYWEYFISLVICERMNEEMLRAFMTIDYALIGNSSTIFISDFCNYGTLIDVCNKIHLNTSRHLDEHVTMIITIQILSIIDHLHAVDIIHGDIKPDNFMLMSHLSLDSKVPSIKLIDFGNSIDMTRFPLHTTFHVQPLKTEGFICTEMLEERPWTYQTDLFCLAASIHVLLFGRYMKTQKIFMDKVTITQRMPRYFNKFVWDTIFSALLNVPDCKTFPNLQSLKLMLQENVAEKEKVVQSKVNEFNRLIFNS